MGCSHLEYQIQKEIFKDGLKRPRISSRRFSLVMAPLRGWCEHAPAMTCLPCEPQEHRQRDVCVSDFADTPSTEPVGVVVDLMEDLQIDKTKPVGFRPGQADAEAKAKKRLADQNASV